MLMVFFFWRFDPDFKHKNTDIFCAFADELHYCEINSVLAQLI